MPNDVKMQLARELFTNLHPLLAKDFNATYDGQTTEQREQFVEVVLKFIVTGKVSEPLDDEEIKALFIPDETDIFNGWLQQKYGLTDSNILMQLRRLCLFITLVAHDVAEVQKGVRVAHIEQLPKVWDNLSSELDGLAEKIQLLMKKPAFTYIAAVHLLLTVSMGVLNFFATGFIYTALQRCISKNFLYHPQTPAATFLLEEPVVDLMVAIAVIALAVFISNRVAERISAVTLMLVGSIRGMVWMFMSPALELNEVFLPKESRDFIEEIKKGSLIRPDKAKPCLEQPESGKVTPALSQHGLHSKNVADRLRRGSLVDLQKKNTVVAENQLPRGKASTI